MTFGEGFRGRVINATTVKGATDTTALDAGRGALLKLISTSKELESVVNDLTDDAILDLVQSLKSFDKTSTKSAEKVISLIEKTGKLNKISDERINRVSKEILFTTRRNEQAKREATQAVMYFDQRVKHFTAEKRMLQAQVQMQRNAIENWEKNFWGPFRNFFKGSHVVAYAKIANESLAKTTSSLVGGYVEMLRRVNQTAMTRTHNELGVLMAEASTEFTKEAVTSAKELFKGLKEGFSEGKEKYFQRKQERIAKMTEKSFEHFDHIIEEAQSLQEIIEEQMESSFGDFDDSVSLFREYLHKAMGLEDKKESNLKKEEEHTKKGFFSSLFGRGDGGHDEKTKGRIGALFSGGMEALGKGIPIVGEFFGNSFKQVTTLAASFTNVLLEDTEKFHETIISIRQDVGGINHEMEELLDHQFNLTKGVEREQAMEAYLGLYHTFGNINKASEELINNQVYYNKVFGFTNDEGANFTRQLSLAGVVGKQSFEAFDKQVQKFSRKEGVSSKEIMRDIAKNTNWIALVSSPKMVTNFAKSAAELRSMGLHMDTMMKVMDAFEDIGSATEKSFQLNAALGTQLNPFKMSVLSLQGDVSAIQDEIFGALRGVQTLSVMQVKAISQALGLTNEEVRALHNGLHIQDQMRAGGSEMNKLQREMLNMTGIRNKLMEGGFTQESEQQEYIAKRVGELYERHKSEFKDFNTFQSQLTKSPKLKHELELSIEHMTGEKSIQEQLLELVTNEQLGRADLLTAANSQKDELKMMTLLQAQLNDLMAQLLGWSIKVSGNLLASILRSLGGNLMANKIEEMGNKFSSLFGQMQKIEIAGYQRLHWIGGEHDDTTHEWHEAQKELIDNFSKLGDKINRSLNPFWSFGDNPDLNWRQKVFGMDENLFGIEFPFLTGGFNDPTTLRSPFGFGVNMMAKKDGGSIRGPGGPKDDKVPLWGSNGEFMMRQEAVDHWGLPFMEFINAKGFRDGGPVDPDYAQYGIEEKAKKQLANSPKQQALVKFLNSKKVKQGVDKGYSLEYNNDLINVDALLGNGFGSNLLEEYAAINANTDKRSFHDANKSNSLQNIESGAKAASQGILGFFQTIIPDEEVQKSRKALKSDLTLLGMDVDDLSYYGGKYSSELLQLLYAGGSLKSIAKLAPEIGMQKAIMHEIKHAFSHGIKGVLTHGLKSATTSTVRDLSKGHFDLSHTGLSFLAGAGGLAGEATEYGAKLIANTMPDNISKNAGFMTSIINFLKEGHGVTTSHANGTMPGGVIPGFVSTNDIDRMILHKNESVQVMNAQQKITRDTMLEELINSNTDVGNNVKALINILTNGGTTHNITIMLDGKEVGKSVAKTLMKA